MDANYVLALPLGPTVIGFEGSHVRSIRLDFPNRYLGGLLGAEVICPLRPEPLLFDHFLPAAAAWILVATLARCGALRHRDFATAFRIRAAINFTLLKCHVGLL